MISGLALVVLAGAGALPLWAQPAPIPHHLEPYRLESGAHKALKAETALLFRETVQVSGVPWLRLHFDDYDLGTQSFIRITSLADGAQQVLDADSLAQWYNSSAFFNGDSVEVELYVAPGETDVFIKIQEITVGEWADGEDIGSAGGDVGIESICGGDDDRVHSDDPRVGRIVPAGCTGWIVSNGAHLTAGHCTGTAMQTLEFNIPNSLANGTIRHPGPEDQYPIDAGSIVFNNDGAGAIGNDWAVFGCNANSNTGLLPVQAQKAFYRMSRDSSPANVRVTGCGQDNDPPGSTGGWNSDNQTLQTHWGTYVGETVEGASDVIIEYIVDTMGGSSGSPVIIYGTTTTIGIHTNAGCDPCEPPDHGNHGTGFEHNNLENAIETFPGSNVVYVDAGHPATSEDGAVLRPYHTVTEAITWVLDGGIVSIVAGSYGKTGNTFTAGEDGKRMTFSVPVGTVTIGN